MQGLWVKLGYSSLFLLSILQFYFFARSDSYVVPFYLLSGFFIYQSVIDWQTKMRHVLALYAKKDTWLEHWLMREHSMLSIGLSLLFSAVLSFCLLVVLSGLLLVYGHSILFFFLFFVVFYAVASIQINRFSWHLNSFSTRFSCYATTSLSIIFWALFLNVLLSLFISFYDVNNFFHSYVSLSNFDSITVQQSIVRMLDNQYSRLLLNMYLLVDNFKLALVYQLSEWLGFFSVEASFKHYSQAYALFFVFNAMKLFALSLSVVLWLKGFQRLMGMIK